MCRGSLWKFFGALAAISLGEIGVRVLLLCLEEKSVFKTKQATDSAAAKSEPLVSDTPGYRYSTVVLPVRSDVCTRYTVMTVQL